MSGHFPWLLISSPIVVWQCQKTLVDSCARSGAATAVSGEDWGGEFLPGHCQCTTTMCVQQTPWVMVPLGPDPCSIGSLFCVLGKQEGSLDCFPWYYLAASLLPTQPPTCYVWSFRSFSHRRLQQSLEIFRQFYTLSLMHSAMDFCFILILDKEMP